MLFVLQTWRLNPSLIPFRPGRALKGKHIKKNPDIVPYSHDPPGHTCGLPCCSENLQIQLRIRKPPRSCIGIQDFDVIQQNFTFRGRFNTRTRPVLESGFFSVQAPKDETRGAIPKFGSVSVGGLKRITDNQRQYNFLKGREITLPESKDPKAVEKLYLENFDVGETDDVLFVSDDDIEYYLSVRNPNEKPKGVPYPPRDIDQSIYPWDMLKEMKQNHENGISNNDKVDDSSSSNYYEILRYPDDMNKPLQTTKLVKQFSVAIPPKLPAQTIYNHPPLSTVSSPLLCENYLNQISKVNNQPQKFNTYSTLYSFYNSANQMRDSYERHLSLDRALGVHRAFRPDVRDVSFEYEKSQDEDKLYQTHQIVKEMKKFQKNSVPLNKNNITIYKEQLGTKLQPKMDPLKVEDRKNKIIADRDDDDDDDFGLDNPAFKNINIDGKFHSTKTLNIDGKLRGTRSLDYRQHIQGLSEWKKEQNINKSQSLDYRKKPAGSRVMDMDGNALETKNFEQINNLCCEKLISLMKESKRTENEEEDENPVTLIL